MTEPYTLILSTYNIRQTVKVDLYPDEVDLLNDISSSLTEQKASINLELEPVEKVKKP
jgi:hypothetical protein